MNSELQATVLGIVQGLTEFLPVSSSAHLTIIPWLFRWPDPGLAFDVALHLGTLVALLAYYWRDWLALGLGAFNGDRVQRRLLAMLVVASIPGALFGLLFEKQAETVFRSPLLIAGTVALLGVALWLADRVALQTRTIGEATFADAVILGVAQALAIVPGVSRSGITITVGRMIQMKRADAANFSFLMATPIIAGAGIMKARDLFHGGMNASVSLGFLAAAVFGLLAISLLIRYVKSRTYQAFALYRLVMSALILATFATRS